MVVDNLLSTVHGNLSTSNNNNYGVSMDITNDDGNSGDSGGGGINDVNVQTMTGEITLARYGGVGKMMKGR